MSIPSWARVGAKVVCIDDTASQDGIPCPLVVLEIYTITRIWPRLLSAYEDFSDVGVEVAEFDVRGRAFWITRFRPLVTRTQEQDVAAIRKLVDEMPQEIRVDLIGELL